MTRVEKFKTKPMLQKHITEVATNVVGRWNNETA